MTHPAAQSPRWTLADAERYLLGLELFGMRFGLDRMRRLLTALGQPQEDYPAVHVVGSNGKSSTTRMIAAILEAHGLRTGAYLSPHLVSFAERVRVADADSEADRFAAAVQRAAHAAELVDRTLGPDDCVTQFEALTAGALSELSEQQVDAAVIEAGLGGRFDATNVLSSSPVQVLTNVSLEHTRWLGPAIADIAAEKLDVVRPGATLVIGPDLHPDAMAVAERVAAERDARIVVGCAVDGPYPARNLALARAAAEAFLGELDPDVVAEVGARIAVPGRFEVAEWPEAPAGDRSRLVLDGAHNPAGMDALVQALRPFLEGRPLVAVVAVLEDKDAASMLAALLPLCEQVVFCRIANPRALSPATLISLARQTVGTGGPTCHTERDPEAAVELGRELAGPDGVVLVTGSIYLLADLLRPRGAPGASL